MNTLQKTLHYLNSEFTIPLRDPLWKHIYLSAPIQNLIFSEPFLRLGKIRQLSSATLIYPGARHTRYEHSIGVFWMARQLLLALFKNPKSRESLEEIGISLHGVKAFLAAALLHDLGHFPYAHSLEMFPKTHEEISADRILEPLLSKIIQQDLGTDPELVAALIDVKRALPVPYEREGSLYRSLLSGTLDPDKMDYLNRDAYYCGVPYGVQDLQYLSSQVHLGEGRLCIPERGLTIIENLIFSRYLMYRSIYWHRNVRALSAPIVEACLSALQQNLIEPEMIYQSTDADFPSLFKALDFPEKKLCLDAQKPLQYFTAAELCLGELDREDPLLQKLHHPGERRKIARELHRELLRKSLNLEPWKVILDLSGPRKLTIQDIGISKSSNNSSQIIPFMLSNTVLKENTLKHFCSSLTMLRLILPRSESEKLPAEQNLLVHFLSRHFPESFEKLILH